MGLFYLFSMKTPFFLLIILLSFGANSFAESASKIEKEFQKISKDINALERDIHTNNLGIYQAQKELKKLDKKETSLRKHWVSDVKDLNQAVLQPQAPYPSL